MQFTVTTARDYDADVTVAKLNDPAYSIDMAGQFLRDLSQQFGGDDRKAIMSYNQGAGNTRAGKGFASPYYAKWQIAATLIEQG